MALLHNGQAMYVWT